MTDERFVLNDLDTLATESYPGLVVRKDLLRRMRSAFGVPAFVIEFLLGKYCASTDEETIREGLEFVRETLAGKYVKPDEREAVKSAIKQHTSFEIIDKISVRLIETHDKYWARLSNLDLDYINIEESEVRRHDRLLMGGIWAEVTLRYDDAYIFKNQNRPFFRREHPADPALVTKSRQLHRGPAPLHARPVARPDDALHRIRAGASLLH